MANPFPFTAGQVLTAAQMNGIGENATLFTPTFTNYTRGNGTSSAYYLRVNKLVYVYCKETLGSTSSVTGLIRMTLPIAAVRTNAIQNTRAWIEDAATNLFFGTTYSDVATQVTLQADLANSTYVVAGSTSATIPMTWAVNDSFGFGLVYEVA